MAMEQQDKETILKVADYTAAETGKLMRMMRIIFLIGVLTFISAGCQIYKKISVDLIVIRIYIIYIKISAVNFRHRFFSVKGEYNA